MIYMNPTTAKSCNLCTKLLYSLLLLRIPYITRDQGPYLEGWLQRFDLRQHGPVKRDKVDTVEHSGRTYFAYDGFGDARITPIGAVALAKLDLDIDTYTSLRKIQYFAQGGNLLRLRPATREMSGGIQRTQRGKIEIQNIALAVREPLYSGVVKNDGMPVAAELHVQFYSVDGQ